MTSVPAKSALTASDRLGIDPVDNSIVRASSTSVRQLFVGNLPFSIRWQDLKDLFRTTGKVLRADLAIGPDHRSKGYGTVLFATAKDAQTAIDMLHNTKWHGRVLKVRPDRSFVEKKPPSKEHGTIARHEVIQPSRQLFVGNIPFQCQWQDIKDLFRGAGKIIRADVAQEPGGKSRGFGSVLFATIEDATNAIDMFDQFEYCGRILRVNYDKFATNHRHHGLLLQQPIFDSVGMDSLNQTYGSAYIPNPSDVVYSPSMHHHDYLEPLSTGHLFLFPPHHRSSFNEPYSQAPEIKGTYDYQTILHQHTVDSQPLPGFFIHQNQPLAYPTSQEKHQDPHSINTVYPLYLQRPHLEWHDDFVEGMQRMGLSENESAGLANLDESNQHWH